MQNAVGASPRGSCYASGKLPDFVLFVPAKLEGRRPCCYGPCPLSGTPGSRSWQEGFAIAEAVDRHPRECFCARPPGSGFCHFGGLDQDHFQGTCFLPPTEPRPISNSCLVFEF